MFIAPISLLLKSKELDRRKLMDSTSLQLKTATHSDYKNREWKVDLKAETATPSWPFILLLIYLLLAWLDFYFLQNEYNIDGRSSKSNLLLLLP